MKPARAPAQINCTMAHYIPEGGGGGVLPYKNDGVLVVPSLGVKNAVLVAFKIKGHEKACKIQILWQELKNRFPSFFAYN